MKRIEGKAAVVTGAASGIGRATAELLARRGCRLAICDVNEEGLEETRRRIEQGGGTVTSHGVDVADKRAMAAFAHEVSERHGGAQILVNNAGVSVTVPFADMSLEDFEWIVGINFWGVVYGCKLFLPQLLEAGEGHIVNVSSVFGIIGLPTQSAYASTKFAVRGLSESLRAELASRNVGVTSVHPGAIKTNIVRDSRVNPEGEDLKAQTTEWFERNGMDPAAAAQVIVRSIERNAPRAMITAGAYGIDFGKRLMPETTDRVATLIARMRGVV